MIKSSPFLNLSENNKFYIIKRIKALNNNKKSKKTNESLSQNEKDKIWNEIQESNRQLDERIAKGPTPTNEREHKIPKSKIRSRIKPFGGW